MVSKKLALITGTSKGLGYQVALKFCENNWFVYGFSRSAGSISHQNYTHVPMDLSDIEDSARYFETEFLKIVHPEKWDEIVLVNNAGQLGVIERLSELSISDYMAPLQLNVAMPSWLMGFCYKIWRNKRLTFVNISSGAATKPYSAWFSYCTSKAALRMASLVFWQEVSENKKASVRVFSYAPGVIDTDMQVSIRSSDADVFSQHAKFQKLFDDRQLIDPALPAAEIFQLVNDDKMPAGFYELRYGDKSYDQSANN